MSSSILISIPRAYQSVHRALCASRVKPTKYVIGPSLLGSLNTLHSLGQRFVYERDHGGAFDCKSVLSAGLVAGT